ncbi:hypothetical protein L830_0316 [Mycobacteroides abscessus MAB_082312_2258]|nr:hypothetical protein L830_0316 [Mycobacteroides abscessus MAB_082312_2258]
MPGPWPAPRPRRQRHLCGRPAPPGWPRCAPHAMCARRFQMRPWPPVRFANRRRRCHRRPIAAGHLEE